MWSQDGQQTGANCPFEATVAGLALRLAELNLERLVHEADKPKRQEAANAAAAEHGPWRLSDQRLHAREQA